MSRNGDTKGGFNVDEFVANVASPPDSLRAVTLMASVSTSDAEGVSKLIIVFFAVCLRLQQDITLGQRN